MNFGPKITVWVFEAIKGFLHKKGRLKASLFAVYPKRVLLAGCSPAEPDSSSSL